MMAPLTPTPDFDTLRTTMVQTQLVPRGIHHPKVLEAMSTVPRHLFIPQTHWAEAYADHPVAIGLDQTISQPYMVALMTELLDPQPGQKVLEIGTGCGYQTALLATLFDTVYTIERFEALLQPAKDRLCTLGYTNIHYRVGDGSLGWAAAAPFDAIILTAAAPSVPPPLMRQLNHSHGKLLLPLAQNDTQTLVLLTRTPETIRRQDFGEVLFVPLVGEHGFSQQ